MLTFPSTNRPRTQKSPTRRICNQRTALNTTTCSIKTPLRCIGTACNCYKEPYEKILAVVSLSMWFCTHPPFFWSPTLLLHPPTLVHVCRKTAAFEKCCAWTSPNASKKLNASTKKPVENFINGPEIVKSYGFKSPTAKKENVKPVVVEQVPSTMHRVQ